MPDELHNSDRFDPLDGLLAKAQWPAPSPGATQRLRDYWSELRTPRPVSPWLRWSAFAAAAAIVIAAVGIWRWQPAQVAIRLSPSEAEPPAQSISAGRPPTRIELAILHVLKSQRLASPQVMPPMVRPSLAPTVLSQRILASTNLKYRDSLLDDLVIQGPSISRQALLNLFADRSVAAAAMTAVCRHPDHWTDALFDALSEPRISVRLRAAEALAQIDGPVITRRLITMANTDVNRREAVAALVRIHSNDARQFVTSAMQSSDLGGMVRSATAQYSSNQHQTGVLQ